MDPADFDRRRDEVAALGIGHPLRLAVRQEPSRSTEIMVTATAVPDGRWRAEFWDDGYGGIRAAESVLAETLAAAVDWCWWMATERLPDRVATRAAPPPDAPVFERRWWRAPRPDTPVGDVAAWAAEDPALWSTLLARADATADDLAALDAASSGAKGIRAGIVRHPNASAALLDRLAGSDDPGIGVALLESGRLSSAGFARLAAAAAGWLDWGFVVPGHRFPLDPASTARFADDRVAALRAVSAGSTALDHGTALRLAGDRSEWVRTAVASATLPPDVLARVRLHSMFVREALASNPGADARTLTRLARGSDVAAVRAVARNTAAPTALLERLVRHADPEVRAAAEQSLAARTR